jgi:hypothetical protein
MLQKYLLIGIGGSGGKTLRYTWRELDRRLKATGWDGGVPRAWRFLHIDVPEHPDVVEGDVPSDIGTTAAYLGMAEAPRQYREYDEELSRHDELLPAIAGWRPNPALDYTSPFRGAGQRRVVGRVITLTRLNDVGRAIDREVSQLMSSEVEEELRAINRHLELDDTGSSADPPTAIVISSLGGGAGSGALLDIIELLKARATEQAQWLDNSLMTILYAADVFAHLPDEARRGVEPNTLAALSELLSAFEHEGPVSELEDLLLDRGGATRPIRGRRTALYNFFIGSKNESVAFPTGHHVFTAVGKALAAQMANEQMRQQFNTYVQTNWGGQPVMPEFRVTDLDRMNHAASSFGYSNVSLGRALFAQYATERLARRALERLLRGHREQQAPGALRREETLIAERAAAIKESFFEASGLWEVSTANNQVLDELRDARQKARALDDVVARVRSRVQQDGGEHPPMSWFKHFTSLFDDAAREYEQRERTERTERAEHWVPAIQKRVLATVAAYAGRHGLPVTLELLRLLDLQVSDAAEELEQDSQKADREETSALNHVLQIFKDIRDAHITPNHERFGHGLADRRSALQRRTESELYAFAAQLLRDLGDGFLPQLRSAMAASHAGLARSERGEYRGMVEQWSTRAVPTHLRPAPNERLLEPLDGFPEQLDSLVMAAFELGGAEDAESAAIEEIVSGMWPSAFDDGGGPPEQRLIRQPANWRPALSAARGPAAGASKASFSAAIDPDRLRAASAAWVRRRRGPVHQHVEGRLLDWLQHDHVDAVDRAARFASAFDQAIMSAQPLISINPTTFRVVHGAPVPRAGVAVTEIPLDVDHRARQRVEESLRNAGVEPGDIDAKFNPNSSASEIELSTFVGSSVHPVVFDSLMGPIQRDWQARGDASRRSQFWQFRRSRTLPAFIPVSPWRQRAIVRGWLTADLLGYVPMLRGSWEAAPLAVWTPRGTERFPKYLLGKPVNDHGSVIPALLESLPLALLTFATGHAGELAAYLRLLDLGQSPTGSHDEYAEVHPEVAAWIEYGVVAEPEPGFDSAPTPPPEVAGSGGDLAEERSRAMATHLRAYESSYREVIAKQKITRESTLTVGPGWEIRDLVLRAADELATAIEQLPGPSESGGRLAVPSR